MKSKSTTVTDFALSVGVSTGYIRMLISKGIIKSCKKNKSGHWMLDAEAAEREIKTGLSGSHRKKIDREQHEQQRRADGGMTFAEAQRVKENYMAALKKLEYDKKSGKMISAEGAIRAWSDHIVAAKTKLLSIPSKIAPIAADLDDPRAIQAAVSELINEILTDLANSVKEE